MLGQNPVDQSQGPMGLLVYARALFIYSQLLGLLWIFLRIFSLAEYAVGFRYQECTPGLFVCRVSSPAGSKAVSSFFVAQTWAWFCQVPVETEPN